MPGRSSQFTALSAEEERLSERLREHVGALAVGERNIWRSGSLEAAATYIEKSLSALGYETREQVFSSAQKQVKNLEVEVVGKGDEIVIIGAHYDSVPGSPGANDNASGVAALIELAREFRQEKPKRRLRFVAFVNEEMPFFSSGEMGSQKYAARSKEGSEKIIAMISLETIGCYSDEPNSQRYPAPLSLFYPAEGNFIGFVGNLRSGALVRRAIGTFRETTQFPSEGASLPEWIPGVSWSDHASFWPHGYRAIMVTDTAPYRYPYYHAAQDTADKLDYARMARVVSGLQKVIEDLTHN
ncbi:MAG: M20/M25/M40 family metallo-hydrolase [Burkholderiales bacterium]